MAAQPTTPPARHAMRTVVLRTGLTPDLLRAWEKRYGVVEPTRSEGGQRLYSDADLERLTLLTHAVRDGRAISQVAKLPTAELRAIVAAAAAYTRVQPPVAAAAAELCESMQAEALRAVERLDAAALESTLRAAAMRLGMDEMLDDVIAPLLQTIGSRWHQGLLRPAHEHLATAVVQRTLAWLMDKGAPAAKAPTLVVVTLAGQAHELGALLAAAVASSQGWHVVYLGVNLSAEEIAAAANQTRAYAVALSFVYPRDDPAMPGALRELRAALPVGTAIIAGGAAAVGYADALAAVGAASFSSISELRSWLRRATSAR
jgi:MerR family transcriptional regulator, light-induced transcriptional regulator